MLLHNISIMVVDDDSILRRALVRGLRFEGATVTDVEGIEAGREVLAQMRPDLILSDLQLEDGEGTEWCGWGPPVILMTGSLVAVPQVKWVLRKPFTRDSLLLAIKDVLSSSSIRRFAI